MVTVTKISQHGKNSSGSSAANGGMIGVTNVNWGMYVIVYGEGSNRKSITKHCTDAEARAFGDSLKSK